MYCDRCGAQIEDGQKFCENCGNSLSQHVEQEVSLSTPPPTHQEIKPKKSFFSNYKLKNIDLAVAEKHIKNAWIAALISAGLTALFVALGILDVWSWLDVGLILLFALGIYRKNRIAAVGMFVYFIISKLIQIEGLDNFNIGAMLVALAFINYFYLGMAAVIRHQQLVPKKQRRKGVVFGVVIGSLATVFIVFLLIGLLPEEASPQDVILQADYQEGYKAGYVDGRGSQANIGDSYVQIATEERRGAFDLGYLKGFIDGCHEGGFDCSEVEQTIDEALGDTELPTDSNVQLIPPGTI